MKRAKHQSYDLFSKEVNFHKEIIKKEETLRRYNNGRPVTAKSKEDFSPNKIKITIKRPESSNLERVYYFCTIRNLKFLRLKI